ncbi:MAG: hypothetical protein ACREID_00965 [Planctomycetota bacterium]
MTPDFAVLLAAAAAAAYGAAVTVARKPAVFFGVAALLLYTFAGVHSVLLAALTGDGRLVPGLQLNPDLVRYWGETTARGHFPAPHAAYGLTALLAHALLFSLRPERGALVQPLPSTLVFLALFFVLKERAADPETLRFREIGPSRAAYLTVAPDGDGVRMIVAHGDPDEAFLRVLHLHRAESPPPSPQLFWTKDGAAVIVGVRHEKLLALGLDGSLVGELPSKGNEWPQADPSLQPPLARARLSEARVRVARYVQEHGDIFVP